MKKILLASGCSYTTHNYNSHYHTDMKCDWPKWPQILADKLGMDCINVGQSGAGQEYIYTSIVNNIHKENIGLVIAGWSRASRRDYYYRGKAYWQNDIWDEKGDNHYFINRSLMFQYSFQQLCKSFNLEYKHFQMIDSYETANWAGTKEIWPQAKGKLLSTTEHYLHMQKNPLFNLIDDNFLGFPGNSMLGGYSFQRFLKIPDHIISEKDVHPNGEGQKVLAEAIYERLG